MTRTPTTAAAIALLSVVCLGAAPDPAPPRATIQAIQRTVLPDVVRVTIQLDREVVFHDERIDNPRRVFVDLQSTQSAPPLVDGTLRFDGDNAPVHQIRLGRHPDGSTRVVLDALDVAAYSVYPLYKPFRLVIDCSRTAVAPVTVAPGPPALAALKGRRIGRTPLKALPAGRPAATARIRQARLETPTAERQPVVVADAAVAFSAIASAARAPVPDPLKPRRMGVYLSMRLPVGTPAAAAKLSEAFSSPPPADPVVDRPAERPVLASLQPPARTAGSYTVARQLGLGVSRIVIDPGHGGHDPGAQHEGVTEADVVLDIALRLEALLTSTPGTDVVLTRRTDQFVALQERTAIANRENADLFLSIHGNANDGPLVRGIETYFLNFASTLSSAAVAARENAASGQAMAALPDFVKAIALNNKLDESREFATLVQRGLVEKLRTPSRPVKDLGVKQAPFVVIIGAAMPSVLAEISFVTNTQEARLLKTPAYRQRIAEGLYSAVRKYQTSLQSTPTAALRPTQ